MARLHCFKAYDIRGRVPDTLDADIARRIGLAYAEELAPGTVVVGRDVRPESPELARAVSRGLVEGGARVIDIGLCGTEEVYFHAFHREGEGVGGGIMVTASHNPRGYNGMKLVREGARPISGDTGLDAIRARAESLPGHPSRTGAEAGNPAHPSRPAIADGDPLHPSPPGRGAGGEGTITHDPDKTAYIEHLLDYIDPRALKPLKIVANPGNGGAGPVIRLLEARLPLEFVVIQEEPDGEFPNGIPNPLLPENREATARAVREHEADFGIAWDGDFDRCFLFDENGTFIEGYYIVGLLAEAFLRKHPGEKIIHDPRLTWNTIDIVEGAGGKAIQSKTGHAFIKERMRRENAIYGGEMSAHHYFRDFGYCDSGMIPWLLVAELMSKTGRSLSTLVGERVAAWPCSGEINYRVADVAASIEKVRLHFLEQADDPVSSEDRTDGLSLEFQEWRFNLRGSNTEPLLRLNVESRGDTSSITALVKTIESLLG